MGIVVSRKVGNAVVRNRVRRRLREGLLALLKERIQQTAGPSRPPSLDLMIIARPSAAVASFQELKRGLTAALEKGKVAWLA